MQISDTPDSPVAYTREIVWDLFYDSLDGFSLIPHAYEWGDNRLIHIWIHFIIFLAFFLNIGDVLECLGVEWSTEFDYYFAREFWSDTACLGESLWFTTGYSLHDFILSELEKSDGSFWSKSIDGEEFTKYSFVFHCLKSDKARSWFCLMVVYPELESVSEILQSDGFWLYCDGIAYSTSEEGDVSAVDELECTDEERNHIMMFTRFLSLLSLLCSGIEKLQCLFVRISVGVST